MTDPQTAAPTVPTAPATQLSAREHAALALRLPASGTGWLDAMINHASLRDAADAMYRSYAAQKLDDANLAIIKKNGIEAWMKANGSDLEAARQAADAMVRPIPKSVPRPLVVKTDPA